MYVKFELKYMIAWVMLSKFSCPPGVALCCVLGALERPSSEAALTALSRSSWTCGGTVGGDRLRRDPGGVQEVFGMGANAQHLWLPAAWLGALRHEVLRLHPVAVLEVLAAVRSLGDNTLAEIREWCRSVDEGNSARLAWWDDGPTAVETLVVGATGTSSSCPSTPMVGPLGVEVTGVETTWTSLPPCSSSPEMPGGAAAGTSSPPCSSTSLEVAVALAPGAASGAVVGDLDVVEVVQEDAP